jgi:hypothetical protein
MFTIFLTPYFFLLAMDMPFWVYLDILKIEDIDLDETEIDDLLDLFDSNDVFEEIDYSDEWDEDDRWVDNDFDEEY